MLDSIERKSIERELSACEEQKDIRVLLAVESGSRCWGFASDDSDYDVRFVYARPQNSYLSLKQPRDTIDWRLDDELDVMGWDITKFLRLLRSSNPQTFEWLGSPIVYRQSEPFERVRRVAAQCFNPVSNAHHYLGMSKRNVERCVFMGRPSLKRYLYCLRAILACRWVVAEQSPAPMAFSQLKESLLEPELVPLADDLVERKRAGHERKQCEPIPQLDGWLTSQLDVLEHDVAKLQAPEAVAWSLLDEVFLHILEA